MMNNNDIILINAVILEQRQTGHCLFDYDDYRHDLQEMADVIGVEMIYDEDEEEWIFQNMYDECRVKEALAYYYETA